MQNILWGYMNEWIEQYKQYHLENTERNASTTEVVLRKVKNKK